MVGRSVDMLGEENLFFRSYGFDDSLDEGGEIGCRGCRDGHWIFSGSGAGDWLIGLLALQVALLPS